MEDPRNMVQSVFGENTRNQKRPSASDGNALQACRVALLACGFIGCAAIILRRVYTTA